MFKNINFTTQILNIYSDSWFIWVGFLVIGFLLFKYAKSISINIRDQRKKEDAGAGLIALGVIVHIFVLIAFIKSA